MNRYIIYVEKIHTKRVEVEAADDTMALEMARRACFYHQPDVSDKIGNARIVNKGPAGVPLVALPVEWEIYTSKAGAITANKAISAAAKKVADAMLKAKEKEADIGPALVKKLVMKHVQPVFKKYRDYGTGDSEPRSCMGSYLSAYAKGLGVESSTCEKIYDEVRWNV